MKHRIFSAVASVLILLTFSSFQPATTRQPAAEITTWGSMSFTVKTITDNGPYSPKHVLAIWVKDANGTFVKSLKVCANARKQYLYTWIGNSNQNVADATTSATLSSHTTHTVSWNCTNVSGATVPDGNYKVCIEYTDQHAQGPVAEFTFTKGPSPQSQTPANLTYFQNMVLTFTPSPAGIESFTTSPLRIYPNPATDKVWIQIPDEVQQPSGWTVTDLQGRAIRSSVIPGDFNGLEPLYWDGKDNSGLNVPGGLYIIRVLSNNHRTYASKVLLSR